MLAIGFDYKNYVLQSQESVVRDQESVKTRLKKLIFLLNHFFFDFLQGNLMEVHHEGEYLE